MSHKEMERTMTSRGENQSLFNLKTPAKPQGPEERLGLAFADDGEPRNCPE